MTPEIKVLQGLKWQIDCSKTSMRSDYVPKYAYTDRTANGLTRCIVDWINLNGGMAERISSTGRMIDKTQVVTNVLGQYKRIGSITYIPGTTRNGTADVSATFKSISGAVVSWKIEVKMKDVQSDAQKKYQKDIIAAGGVYDIVCSFSEFMVRYKELKEVPTQ